MANWQSMVIVQDERSAFVCWTVGVGWLITYLAVATKEVCWVSILRKARAVPLIDRNDISVPWEEQESDDESIQFSHLAL